MSARFVILNPCSKRWTDLPGDDRTRFCPDCQTHIHAIEQYSEAEIADLHRTTPGKLCGYLAGESIPPPRSRRAILVGAMLTAISPLMAQSGRVRIRVVDEKGAVLPQAIGVVLGEDRTPLMTVHANQSGEITFTDLPVGNIRIRVTGPPELGFWEMTNVLANSEELIFDATLPCCVMGEVTLVKPRHPRWWPFRK